MIQLKSGNTRFFYLPIIDVDILSILVLVHTIVVSPSLILVDLQPLVLFVLLLSPIIMLRSLLKNRPV